jgi:hypothetical protein
MLYFIISLHFYGDMVMKKLFLLLLFLAFPLTSVSDEQKLIKLTEHECVLVATELAVDAYLLQRGKGETPPPVNHTTNSRKVVDELLKRDPSILKNDPATLADAVLTQCLEVQGQTDMPGGI